jgi:putative FmdB family regulatory protein
MRGSRDTRRAWRCAAPRGILSCVPLYDFQCASCETTFEEYVFSSGASATCPTCKTDGAERLITGFAGVGGRKAEPSWTSTPAAHRHSGGCGCGHAH